MNKRLLKIIKRQDVKAAPDARTENAGEPKQDSIISEEKSESRLRRELVKEISKWISERGKNNRLEEVAAIRRLFDDDSLLEKT